MNEVKEINDKSGQMTYSGIILRDLFNPVSRHVSLLLMEYLKVNRAEWRTILRNLMSEKTMLELTPVEHPIFVKIINEVTTP